MIRLIRKPWLVQLSPPYDVFFGRRRFAMGGRTRIAALLSLLACAGCGNKQKSTADLLNDLKGTQEKDRITAARLLPQRKGDAVQVIPALIEALKDKDDDVRRSAALGLGSFGEKARDAIPALKAAQHDPDARVREAARRALLRVDPASAQ